MLKIRGMLKVLPRLPFRVRDTVFNIFFFVKTAPPCQWGANPEALVPTSVERDI